MNVILKCTFHPAYFGVLSLVKFLFQTGTVNAFINLRKIDLTPYAVASYVQIVQCQ